MNKVQKDNSQRNIVNKHIKHTKPHVQSGKKMLSFINQCCKCVIYNYGLECNLEGFLK